MRKRFTNKGNFALHLLSPRSAVAAAKIRLKQQQRHEGTGIEKFTVQVVDLVKATKTPASLAGATIPKGEESSLSL